MGSSADRRLAVLLEEEHDLVRRLPVQAGIFLPTDAIPAAERVTGLRRVEELYRWRHASVHIPRLRDLRERWERTDRCFVIGNGPSLARTDVGRLRGEATFATNGIFLLFDDTDWRPTFYVVEDHLVAEDRRDEINALEGFTKLFPINLAYCLEESPDTVFFDHRPRVSYPRGFDFSTNAETQTYAGCTVTFTCLQLAFYLGFKRIYLIGVDCDYTIPSEVHRDDHYGVEVLDMDADDPNHFHPDYFGKGRRWHDPQVDKMMMAFEEAKTVTDQCGVEIFNATAGGKLEIFPRVNYEELFTAEHTGQRGELRRHPVDVERPVDGVGGVVATESRSYPRVLILDLTRIGSVTATGQVKEQLFRGWPADALLQIACDDPRWVTVASGRGEPGCALSVGEALQLAAEFAPDLIYARPLDQPRVFRKATNGALRMLQDVPLVVHMMDDWPSRLRRRNPLRYLAADRDFRTQLHRATMRFSIVDRMSEELAARYGMPFEPFANCVDLDDWTGLPARPADHTPFILRYAGSLAPDMTMSSVFDVARAVETLADDIEIRFEISTTDYWLSGAEAHLRDFKNTLIFAAELDRDEYRRWLAGANACLLSYNFDARTRSYVRLSLANKLPEYLAASRPILAYGPPEFASIEMARASGGALIVGTRDLAQLRATLQSLATDRELATTLGARGRNFVNRHADARHVRSVFQDRLRSAARTGGWGSTALSDKPTASALVARGEGIRAGRSSSALQRVARSVAETLRSR